MKKEFTTSDMAAFEPEAKVGLLATVDDNGLPHITLITTLRARAADRLTWGQFSEGRSKINVRQNPKTGFLVLTMDKRLWRGTARWTGVENTGEDFEVYNNLPMFRYNAYLGIHTVHYMDLVETGGEEKLPMAGIVAASLATRLSRLGAGRGEPVLKPWAEGVFNDMAALKFLAHVGPDGFPRLIPRDPVPGGACRRPGFFRPGLFAGAAGHPRRNAGGRFRPDPENGKRAGPGQLRGPRDGPPGPDGAGFHRLGLQLHAAQAGADLSPGAPDAGDRILI